MPTNKRFCMSSYLMYRAVTDDNIQFDDRTRTSYTDMSYPRYSVVDSKSLYDALKKTVDEATKDGNAALALSGGIDSAILASMMPEGSTAYTFKCVVPGVQVTDETPVAAEIAKKFNLKHKIVEITWGDVLSELPILFATKGAPIHSIECQIYKAGLACKKDGFSKFIFGENADIIYGGMDGLLKKDWLFGEYVDRYTQVMPYKVLKDPEMVLEPYQKYCKDGHVDSYAFTNDVFRKESLSSYVNACRAAGIEFVGPFSKTRLDVPIDLERIRGGDTKYIVRQVFAEIFPEFKMPPKIPMPRPTAEWLKSWEGPVRPEFIPHCTDGMSGDQRWLVFCLEKFLDFIDGL